MTKHNLIQDLMEVYLSGEASEETCKLVDEHLADCEECQEAFEQAKSAEKRLNILKNLEIPVNGKKFITRLRRVLYGVGVGILTLLTIGLASLEYIAFEEVLGLQVPRMMISPLPEFEIRMSLAMIAIAGFVSAIILEKKEKGPAWLWPFLRVTSLILFGLVAFMAISVSNVWGCLGIGVVLLGLYIYLLQRRSAIPPSTNRTDFFHSAESVIPFLTLGVAMGAASELGSILVLSLLMLIALSITLIRLPRLRYMAAATILVMLATVGIVAGQTLNVVWDTLDVFPVLPSALGHPKAGIPLENVVQLGNAHKLGLVLQSTDSVYKVNGIEIGEDAQAQQALYYAANSTSRNDMVTRITVIEFESVGAARAFIDAWYARQSYWEYEHIIDLDTEETLLFEGRFIRSYDSDVALAHNIWQTMNWVTVIETEGVFIDAMNLNKGIREIIVASYEE